MDEENPNIAPLQGAIFSISNNNTEKSPLSRLHVQCLDVDFYVLTEESFGANCVRFTAIAENYDNPVFFGKIFHDNYKIRWQIAVPLEQVVKAVHKYIQDIDSSEDVTSEKDCGTLSSETNGIKIIQESSTDDSFISFKDLPPIFWHDPISYLKEKNISSLEALFFFTPYGEIELSQKGKDGNLRHELCIISDLEECVFLANLIRKTHPLIFDDQNEPQAALESVITNFRRTFVAHSSEDLY